MEYNHSSTEDQRSEHSDLLTLPLNSLNLREIVLPRADSHFVWVVNVGTVVATVTLAKAVVVHAVLLQLLLLTSMSDDSEASLDCTAC